MAQDRLGPVLLVPGRNADSGALVNLQRRLFLSGRRVLIVSTGIEDLGDLNAQAQQVQLAAEKLIADGAPSVDVVGYSAGGVVARLWVQRYDGAHKARRVVTLGSPHHGTSLAAAGTVLAPGACPTACQQLTPGSSLLAGMRTPVPARPAWLAVWTDDDQTVTPPDSGRLEGATNLEIQSVCPGLTVSHGDLPRSPVVAAAVLAELGTSRPAVPGPEICAGG